MITLTVFGSSPLARGTLILGQPTEGRLRLIPARAGNTYHAHRSAMPSPAHPRSRGEHPLNLNNAKKYLGSSPLARGTLFHD